MHMRNQCMPGGKITHLEELVVLAVVKGVEELRQLWHGVDDRQHLRRIYHL
jgi:hypothetical protein